MRIAYLGLFKTKLQAWFLYRRAEGLRRLPALLAVPGKASPAGGDGKSSRGREKAQMKQSIIIIHEKLS